jgi:hypothetical protein
LIDQYTPHISQARSVPSAVKQFNALDCLEIADGLTNRRLRTPKFAAGG